MSFGSYTYGSTPLGGSPQNIIQKFIRGTRKLIRKGGSYILKASRHSTILKLIRKGGSYILKSKT